MSPQEGASLDEFATTLSAAGEGFDDYGRELLAKAGSVLCSRTGSLHKAFETLDDCGQGVIARTTFREIATTHGDINLTEGQLERLWQMVIAAGGGLSSIDFPTFKKFFQPAASSSAGPATSS